MEKPNHYVIIPANVLYDGRLSSTAKLLYGEIISHCSENGACVLTNNYFSELYELHPRQVRRIIKQLKDYGYITITVNITEVVREIHIPKQGTYFGT